ncbi:DUF2726 domain-containing protein [Virgibacillus salexigens]|uniref:DUF2726 domain-containing protein n=1 Tax=Virgibacillus salexigens TaxID=61016 RepID=UPI00190E52CF|nr:DUF2726 domain-containing protein [Virgibacillus salexigens]
MSYFPVINWEEIVEGDYKEPESLVGLFDLLFLMTEDNESYNTFNKINNKSVQFFCNKLMSIPIKERAEDFSDILSYSLYTATFFTLREEYTEAMSILKWLNIDHITRVARNKEIDDPIFLYAAVLNCFVKSQQGDLSEEDVECFAKYTFGKLNEDVHFRIEWNIFNRLWKAHMPLADFFGWSFYIIANTAEQIGNVVDLPVDDVFENYLENLMNIYKIIGIGETNLLNNSLQIIYEKLPHPFLKKSTELFKNNYTNPSNFKKYIREIRKDSLELYESLLNNFINSIFEALTDKASVHSFLKEIEKKKYLIPLLDFTSDSKYLTANNIFEVLVQLGDHSGYRLALSIYNEWLKSDVQKRIKEEDPFYLAYIHSKNGKISDAIQLYRSIYQKEPENLSVINNLAVLYYEELNNLDEALSLLKQGELLDPNHEKIQHNLKNVQRLIEKEQQRPKEAKDRYFKKINKLQRNILFSIYKLSSDGVVTDELIQSVTKLTDYNFYKKNINKLLDLELAFFDYSKGYTLDTTIYKLIQDYINPKIEREVVRSSKNKLFRPIFYHESEIKLYQALIELFPQQLVFPNMDLKTIIDVDKVKQFLDPDIIEYMFKAHVDFAIINNTTYLPILCIEKDSSFQDESYGANNAIKKNTIFNTSGLPLIRIRFNSAMDNDRLREEVKQATKEFLLQTQKEDDIHDILKEFDLKSFGIYTDLPSKEQINIIWKQLVGDMIYKETKDIVLDKSNAQVEFYIPKSLEQVLEYGKEDIKAGLYDKYPSLNSIRFIFN